VLYFEVTMLTDNLMQIGVGDDVQSISFDGSCKCLFVLGQQVALDPAVLGSMPEWRAGAVVGVGPRNTCPFTSMVCS
jgi:hypothetical protein